LQIGEHAVPSFAVDGVERIPELFSVVHQVTFTPLGIFSYPRPAGPGEQRVYCRASDQDRHANSDDVQLTTLFPINCAARKLVCRGDLADPVFWVNIGSKLYHAVLRRPGRDVSEIERHWLAQPHGFGLTALLDVLNLLSAPLTGQQPSSPLLDVLHPHASRAGSSEITPE